MEYSEFVKEMRQRSDPLWAEIIKHPFVRGIGDGTLSKDRFEFYLKQDYAYLIEFSRVFALAAAKARNLADMTMFADLLNATLKMEMELHRRVCADYGITNEELEGTKPGLTTTAYAKFLNYACYEGALSDITAVLLPCASGYVEIAENLRSKGMPDQKHYRDWIETYSSDEMNDLVQWLIDKMNCFARESSTEQKEHWFYLYQYSARFELLFFEMGWTKEEWPPIIPV